MPACSQKNKQLVVFSCFGCVRLFVTLWTVACQAPLSLEFSRQEYWSGLPFLPPGDLPDSGIEPKSPASVGRFFTAESLGKLATSFLKKKKKDTHGKIVHQKKKKRLGECRMRGEGKRGNCLSAEQLQGQPSPAQVS